MTEILLEEKTHTYQVDGIEKPSVTQILKSVGLIDDSFYTDFGADRGTKAHKATALYDSDNLDEASLDPILRPYLDAWKAFRGDTGFRPNRIEERFYAKAYGFCGTIDRWGLFQDTDTVVEIKTGQLAPWHRLQVAAYKLLLQENAITCLRRLIVYLSDSGCYKIDRCDLRSKDEAIFLAALSIVNFKKNHGG